jgi:hypothetical protein
MKDTFMILLSKLYTKKERQGIANLCNAKLHQALDADKPLP